MDRVSDDVVQRVRAHLRAELGDDNPGTASVTFLGLEPMDILRFRPDDAGVIRFASVGCSRHPMTDPGAMVADPHRGPRAELVLGLRTRDPTVTTVKTAFAILAASPAVEGVVFVPDALIDLGEPLWNGAPFTAVLVTEGRTVPELVLDEPYDPVHFFDIVPITSTEAAWVRLRGADALRDAWAEAGIDVLDPNRAAARL